MLIKDSLDNSNIVTKTGSNNNGIKTYSEIPIISSLATTGNQAVNKTLLTQEAGIKNGGTNANESAATPPLYLKNLSIQQSGMVSFGWVNNRLII